MTRYNYTIAQFKHRVAVCTMKDVVQTDGVLSLARQDVYHCWAKIIPSVGSLFNGAGDAIKQSREVRTHKIVVRFRRDIDFTQAAWFYEERLQSGARWFKLLDFYESGECAEYVEAAVRLVERGVELSAPTTPVATCETPYGAVPVPEGVQL